MIRTKWCCFNPLWVNWCDHCPCVCNVFESGRERNRQRASQTTAYGPRQLYAAFPAFHSRDTKCLVSDFRIITVFHGWLCFLTQPPQWNAWLADSGALCEGLFIYSREEYRENVRRTGSGVSWCYLMAPNSCRASTRSASMIASTRPLMCTTGEGSGLWGSS